MTRVFWTRTGKRSDRKNLLRSVKRLLLPMYWRIRRILFPPRIHRNGDGIIRLHLGCGTINAPGFINVDLRPNPNVHLVHDVSRLKMFSDNSVDMVYASHILEHLPRTIAKRAIEEWYRILKLNGVLRLAVPDFGVIVRMYIDNVSLDIISGPLLGAQHYEENYHKSVFNELSLKKMMAEVGFKKIKHWDPTRVSWHDFKDGSNKVYEVHGKQYHISLNLEGVKE